MTQLMTTTWRTLTTIVGMLPVLSLTVEFKNKMSLQSKLHSAIEQLTPTCSGKGFIVRNYDRTQTAFSGSGPI